MTATNAPALKIGTRRVAIAGGYRYVGLLRDGRRVVAECPHEHANRDMSGRRGTAASECIRDIAHAAANLSTTPTVHAGMVERERNGWQSLTRGFHTFPASTIASARVECAERADKLDALIRSLADLLAGDDYAVDRRRLARRF